MLQMSQHQHANQKDRQDVADVTIKMHTRNVIFKEVPVANITRMKMNTPGEKLLQEKESQRSVGQFVCCDFLLYFIHFLFYFIHFLLYFMLFLKTRK